MEHETGALQEIYNLLYADKKLTFFFDTEAQINTFKSSLYRIKRRLEQQLNDIEVIAEEEKQSLVFQISKDESYTSYRVVIFLKEKARIKSYTFVVEDNKE